MKNFSSLPNTDIRTDIVVNVNDDWNEYRAELENDLNQLRIDYDNSMEIKHLDSIDNPLLKKRKNKTKQKKLISFDQNKHEN